MTTSTVKRSNARQWGPFLIETRETPPSSWLFTLSMLSVLATLVLTGVIFALYGQNPITAYVTLAQGTLGDLSSLGVVLQRAIPLMLIGVGLVVAFRAQFFNIGAEGQLLAGAVGASAVALFFPNFGFLEIPVMFIVAFICGAIWGFIPAILKLKLEINEVISTLMMNYIAISIVEWLVNGPWKGKNQVGYSYTDTFPDAAWIPKIGSSTVHYPTLIVALALVALVAFVISRTRLGFRMRILGENPVTAKYIGINTLNTTLAVVMLSAGAAGIAGAGEVGTIHHKLLDPAQISLGYGYTAIIVAWLARGNPISVIFTAIFLGVVFAAGDVMKVSLQMPAQTTNVINGLLLFFLISTEPLVKLKISLARGTPKDVPKLT
jgi:general nucleoside transport system permease protein